MLGFILLQTGGEPAKPQALKYFSQAVKLSPENIYARVNLAQFYFQENEFDLALEHLPTNVWTDSCREFWSDFDADLHQSFGVQSDWECCASIEIEDASTIEGGERE